MKKPVSFSLSVIISRVFEGCSIMDFVKKYYINSVPWWFFPLFILYSYSLAWTFQLYFFLVRKTSRITIEGEHHLTEVPNTILCYWHQFVPLFPVVFHSLPRFVLMAHPFWYMNPILIVAKKSGVEHLILGSSGSRGKQGADELIQWLSKGYSTFMTPDGPEGPPQILKNGILHIASRSGISITPIRFSCTPKCVISRSWDQKYLPLPFSRIHVAVKEPLFINEDQLDTCKERLQISLNEDFCSLLPNVQR